MRPVPVKKRKVIVKGPRPGDPNHMAMVKVVALAAWIVIPAMVGQPLFPLNILEQYVEDVYGFMQNNTTWWNLTVEGRIFYVYFPFPWIVAVACWYELIFRQRRKRLYVNGQPEGVSTLIIGPGAPRRGHLYDLACIANGFKHIEWGAFPHIYLTGNVPPDVVVYYRSGWFQNPLRWHKISTRATNMTWCYGSLWLDGRYATRVRHPYRPILDYERVTNDIGYGEDQLSYRDFQKVHRDYQEQILKDNYRMTQGEPGVAKILVRSSLMTISEDTRMDFFDQLTAEEQLEYIKKAQEGAGIAGGTPSE